MGIATQVLAKGAAYGWKALVGLTLTGTTIYVANNTLYRIYQRDIIEIVVGTWEKDEATRTGVASWGVEPAMEVRDFVTNAYTSSVSGNVTSWYASPVTETMTNVFGWRTDYPMLTNMDAKLKGAIPYYVSSNAVATSNFTALSVGGVWAALAVGDSTSQFTRVPCHTNNPGETNEEVVAATFGDWARRLFVEPMQERYKVAWYLQKTLHTPQRYDLDLYQGTGKVWMFEVVDGDTPGTYRCTNYSILPEDANDAAYLAAVADYKSVSNGVMSEVPFRQVSSNRYYYHEGLYPTNVSIQTNLLVTITGHLFYCEGGTVTTSGSYRVHTFTNLGATSLTVIGTGLVDVLVVAGGGSAGAAQASGLGGGGGGDVVLKSNVVMTQATVSVVVGGGGGYSTYFPAPGTNSVFMDYTAYGGGRGSDIYLDNTRDGGSGGGGRGYWSGTSRLWHEGGAATGTLGHAGGRGITNFTGDAGQGGGGGGGAGGAGQDAVAGGIAGDGGDGWESDFSGALVSYSPGGGGSGSVSNGLPGDGFYGAGGSAGTASSAGNPGIVVVRYVPVFGLDPSGLYEFAGYSNGRYGPPEDLHPYWTCSNGWFVMWNGNLDEHTEPSACYFVARSETNGVYWPPSWYFNPGPIGASIGSFSEGLWYSPPPYALGTVTVSAVTSTLTFYGLLTNAYVEYKLEKMGGDFNVYLSPNIEHRVEGAFAYTEAPDFATHNYWNDWALGLTEDSWNNIGDNAWSFDALNLFPFGGDLTVPPDEVTWKATAQNESGAEGFCVNENLKAVGDWKFQYCTNKFW